MIAELCNRRGAEVRPGFFRCDSNRLTHPEPGIVAIVTCGICPYRDLADREEVGGSFTPDPRFTSACVHRGDVVEHGVCNACGMKGQPFDVFACELHGKCMVRRYRNDRPELTVCLTCEAYAARDPTCESAQRRRPATPTDSR
jgi:hypothetical protein